MSPKGLRRLCQTISLRGTGAICEVAFSFQLTPAILITGMVFAALMGLVGGLLPALRAARMPITRALRDA